MASNVTKANEIPPDILILTSLPDVANKHDVPKIVKIINQREEQFSNPSSEHEEFYTSYAALSAYLISVNFNHISRSGLANTTQCCKVLMNYLLKNLNGNLCLQQKQLVPLIHGLCKNVSVVARSDIGSISAILKTANIPSNFHEGLTLESKDDKKDPKKPRLDLDSKLLEHLTSPILEPKNKGNDTSNEDSSLITEPGFDIKNQILAKNFSHYLQLKGGEILYNLCLELPSVEQRLRRLGEYLKNFAQSPMSVPTAQSITSLSKSEASDLAIVGQVTTLLVLEPLTSDSQRRLIRLTLACLLVAVDVTIAASVLTMANPKQGSTMSFKDEENEASSIAIVEISLEIYNCVSTTFHSSSRANGHSLQNLHMIGCKLILDGLKFVNLNPSAPSVVPSTKSTPDHTPSKSQVTNSSSKQNILKMHQGFGVLAVALSNHALNLLASLLEDLNLDPQTEVVPGEACLDLEDLVAPHEAWERTGYLAHQLNLLSLWFNVSAISYRKACMLKRIQKHPNDGDAFSTSDSNTYYEDDFSTSDDTSEEGEDEDSEPLLGQWFEETLAPPEVKSETPSNAVIEAKEHDTTALIPEKGEPHGYISLASKVFTTLNTYFVLSENNSLKELFKQSLVGSQMVSLAGIIKDLDKESLRSETGTISIYFGAYLGQLYNDFSQSLSRFLHNVLSMGMMSTSLQNTLLTQLSANPSARILWPLQINLRTLSILAQILLLRQEQDKEASEATCVQIWHQLLRTIELMPTLYLKEEGSSAEGLASRSSYIDVSQDLDINAEHAQFLLYLFHTLPLMQKKTILLSISQSVITVSKWLQNPLRDQQFLYLARLLMFLEYMIKHLYDAPTALYDQVHHNLFIYPSSLAQLEKDNTKKAKMVWLCKEVEENFVKNMPQEEQQGYVIKPKYYSLIPAENNWQDVPKLDGFACSFLFSSPNYPEFYQGLIKLLEIAYECDENPSASPTYLAQCSIFYCFSFIWRLMLTVPPPIEKLEHITSSSTLDLPHTFLSMVWIPRANNKLFGKWFKDNLAKQQVNHQRLDRCLRALQSTSTKHDLKLLQSMVIVQNQSQKPRFLNIFVLEAIVSKLQVEIDRLFSSSSRECINEGEDIVRELLPILLNLIDIYSPKLRRYLIETMEEPQNAKTEDMYNLVLAIASNRCTKMSALTTAIGTYLPKNLKTDLEKLYSYNLPIISWKNDFSNDVIPSESYICSLQQFHFSQLLNHNPFSYAPSLKRFLETLVKTVSELYVLAPDCCVNKDIIKVILPLLTDATTEFLTDTLNMALDRIYGSQENSEFLTTLHHYVLEITYSLVTSVDHESTVDEKVFIECLKYIESLFDKPFSLKALTSYFLTEGEPQLVNLLLAPHYCSQSVMFSTRIIKIFCKLFAHLEKNPTDKSIEKLCTKLNKLKDTDQDVIEQWLSKLIMGPPGSQQALANYHDNRLHLVTLTQAMAKETSGIKPEICHLFLSALIPIGSKLLASEGFCEVRTMMGHLAEASNGTGHVELVEASTIWLKQCQNYLSQKDVLEKIKDNVPGGKHQLMLECCCNLMSYLADIVLSLRVSHENIIRNEATSPPFDNELSVPDLESDWTEEVEEEESAAEDSDEDSLSNKLCTFTVTQKEFMNQHWYHCHTCKMVDGVGVCTICAKICHKDHDVTYAKYGSFFCDCGAKEDGSCQALLKRGSNPAMETVSSGPTPFPHLSDPILPSSIRRRPSSLSTTGSLEKAGPLPDKIVNEESIKQKLSLCKQLEPVKDLLVKDLGSMTETLVSLMGFLMPALEEVCYKSSSMRNRSHVQQALNDLHLLDKKVEMSESLMLPTLGSQEGAFENVRMNYTGDQGQTIRQLIAAHMIRRVAMCCLSSPHGKRQHLAVSHEKGKITILQLSALLKQTDATKKKLVLTSEQRLSAVPVAFVVLTMAGNPVNEDYLAVCGLKDCHILSFTSSGSVSEHLVLQLQLEPMNYIIKAIWLPGSQTEIAIITADFVKIYDLSVDTNEPVYHLVPPIGKYRDCCFVLTEDGTPERHLLMMSSSGQIYQQTLGEECSASRGAFYVTNIIEVHQPDLKDVNGVAGDGGVSLYYSHALQLLCFSYNDGHCYIAPFPRIVNELRLVFPVQVNGNKLNANVLCGWQEIPQHPGLLIAQLQASNNPVVIMVRPDQILVQEIKYLSAKSKITDMVAIRHVNLSSELRTTLILLCEDGSLRIFAASLESTGFWLRPPFQPSTIMVPVTAAKAIKKKKAAKPVANNSSSSRQPGASPTFAVDFFEHCQVMSDVEFAGNDILHVYNCQQVKHRLNTSGLYIACTKPTGFTIEVINPDSSLVMVGTRFFFGNQDCHKSPSYVEIFGRTKQISVVRNRWYDFPFTRDESLMADKQFSIFFSASSDASGTTMVDSIKVYSKTKEAFGWPDEEEMPPASQTALPQSSSFVPLEGIQAAPAQLSPLDKLIVGSLKLLDGCFYITLEENLKPTALDLSTRLLTLATPPSIHQSAKTLLLTLHPSRSSYSNHKDQAVLSYVMKDLASPGSSLKEMDGEAFYRLLAYAREVAVARPHNLVNFALEENSAVPSTFLVWLDTIFWYLYSLQPQNKATTSISHRGLVHVEATVQALVEIIHAFTICDLDHVPAAANYYVKLLVAENTTISFSAKQAVLRVLRPRVRRRKVYIPSPPRCHSPGEDSGTQATETGELIESEVMLPGLLEIPPDADDETMVELAIALSLQEQPGPYSDTTASAGGSDEEGSTAATDGSTLRTSPAEQGGSESGGSGVESIIGEPNVSGRSSAYGDPVQVPAQSLLPPDLDGHTLRLQLLDKMILAIPSLKKVGGLRSIPFMQVILMLSSDLMAEEEKDKATLDNLLSILIEELDLGGKDIHTIAERTPQREVQLIILRLLSIMMSRTKSKNQSGNESFCSFAVSTMLSNHDTIEHCLQILKGLLEYWKTVKVDDKSSTSSVTLLKSQALTPPPDMAPFFLRQYVKGHANDIFEAYPQLLTDMALRIPYQIKKCLAVVIPTTPDPAFSHPWFLYLCEYMMLPQAPFVRRQVRKLLLYICGSKDKYRQLRDFHSFESHMKNVKIICHQGGFEGRSLECIPINLPYDSLVTLIEHLKACNEIATLRTGNWQKYCLKDESTLPFLVNVSFLLNEGVSPVILHLCQLALCGTLQPAKQIIDKQPPPPPKDEDDNDETSPKYDMAKCITLTQQVNKYVSKSLLRNFIINFLFESNFTSVRWQAHSLVCHLYKNSSSLQQDSLLDLMWKLWPMLPMYGRKAAQFVDLLGFFTLRMPPSEKKEREYIEKALNILHQENQLLMNHPNSTIYTALQGVVEFDGYYLENEPCLVCNNPEVSYANIKLSSVKVDSRFTTTTQIVKLIGSHTISKITLRIGDIKRNKMLRTLNIFYNNRTVQSVVELKNKPSIWHKAKRCQLSAGQSELKVEFPLPIIACNLMIEYADFYENMQASSETLQCPRCSASVPSNPGVCASCGENVFQCHKCRAINYDEKDPFLCNSCGFCKYAKFDYALLAKPCCAVDPIENEEDRKKTITTINTLLEKADRVYKQLIGNRPILESCIQRITDHGIFDKTTDEQVPAALANSNVNKSIQQLAQRYCTDCKTSFDELSKVMQKMLASQEELVQYEHRQRDLGASHVYPTIHSSSGKCYGCASAAVESCIIMLRALATSSRFRTTLCSQGLIKELISSNLRQGNVVFQREVHQLLCLLTRENEDATHQFNSLLVKKISTAFSNPELSPSVRHEMALLARSVEKEDTCWEQRMKCVLLLFMMGINSHNPTVMEYITLPCLKMIQAVIKPETFLSKKNKDKTVDMLTTVKIKNKDAQIICDMKQWLVSQPSFTYPDWQVVRCNTKGQQQEMLPIQRTELRNLYLMEKYGRRWYSKSIRRPLSVLELLPGCWVRELVFSRSSQATRALACNMLEALSHYHGRKKAVLDLLTSYLDDVSGENSAEFLSLYQKLIQDVEWKMYLALRTLLPRLATLITREISKLTHYEESTFNSDLSQGFALKMLTELLESFVAVDSIRQQYKGRLVGCVLDGYLSLRKLAIQRTKLIDDTQEKLLELLEQMTTGTESETQAFMAVCVRTVKKYGRDDFRTPVFIFERLCSVIFPEESDSGEFFITLEKDPQQEDFLQGRMLGNPYSSSEPGIGPLMRDIKNKICQDCELVALLEDDNGMELLVNNKIISLDLAVKDVYRKIWCNDNNENDAMRIVYRMRGLLGDATEEFIENLENQDQVEEDPEQVYKMANVMSDCGGLEVMLERLDTITDLTRGLSLLTVLLKLFGYCIKVKINRAKLIDPHLKTITVMLKTLRLILSSDNLELLQAPAGNTCAAEQLGEIMETILIEAAHQPLDQFIQFSTTCGTKHDITFLLVAAETKLNANLAQQLMRLIPFLTYADQNKMEALLAHFLPYLNFNKFDFEHSPDDDSHIECFCVLTSGIEQSVKGNQLKELFVKKGIAREAIDYLTAHAPPIKSAMLGASDEWKEFTSKPALKYVLRLLTGLSQGHDTTQLLVCKECIPIIHRLEQVSSDERVGSLAENLMEAIKKNPAVATKIEEVRKQTRDEKKRMAMAMREKQLGALGMRTNEKGQVTAQSTLLKNVEDLGEESGLVCIICREGYKFQPTKVLGIYTYTKRCNVEDFETKTRKTSGYTTVTHFNIVHVDCHMAAVRHARGRDEWESAALQNANTRCNGLLPLWGPQVPESAFASCLARHNTYLQECTGHRDVSYSSTVHDLKLLLLRFANEKTFSDESGGGGPQSNMNLVPYLMHMALYVLNTTRCASREEKNVKNYLDTPPDKWVENCYEGEGPYYWTTMALLVLSRGKWLQHMAKFLRRLLVLSQARHLSPQGATMLQDAQVKEYHVYKPALVYFGLVDGIIQALRKRVPASNEDWTVSLADYVRHNDQHMLEMGEWVLKYYETELLPCTSFSEFCDVVGLLQDIPDPFDFLCESLRMVPVQPQQS